MHTQRTHAHPNTHTHKKVQASIRRGTQAHITHTCARRILTHRRYTCTHTPGAPPHRRHSPAHSARPHPPSVCSPQRRAPQPRAHPALIATGNREKPAARLPQPPAPSRAPPALRPSPLGEARPHSEAARWRHRSSWQSRGRTAPAPSRPGPARSGSARPRGAVSSLSRTEPCRSASPAAAKAPLS